MDGLLPESIGNYRVTALLGEGTSGTVFRVEDPRMGHRLALKRLHLGEAELKQEFRLAAELRHPNVVLPYTLEEHGGGMFLTMELVEGEPLLDWLARVPAPSRATRIREVFSQLCDGLTAIHAEGLIHRDVKSSNVLVEDSGRVAILDLGLARSVTERERAGAIAGTFAYLAPEVLANHAATPAADAYAVGVLLHQAITGRLPFNEEEEESVWQRVLQPEGPERDSFPPGDTSLVDTCRGLLAGDPTARWSLTRAKSALLGEPKARPAPGTAAGGGVWGREAEVAQLEEAWAWARLHGQTAVVLMEGPSGIGKSTILSAFAAHAGKEVWVLRGRAYDGEALPYRGLDAAFDHLARRLMVLSAEEQTSVTPDEPEHLAELFPVISAALGLERSSPVPRPDPGALRRRAVSTLASLLEKVAKRFGLVILLDDMHGGDTDSARLLRDLLGEVRAGVLVVLTYRSDKTETPFVLEARGLATARAPGAVPVTVRVAPLNACAAAAMALALDPENPRLAAITEEAQGSPFLLQLLLSRRDGEAGVTATAGPRLSVESALRAQLAAVPAEGLRILETVCLARQPLDATALSASPDSADSQGRVWPLVDTLTRLRLVRPSSLPSVRLIEPYHDRIRELVAESLSPERRKAVHRALGSFFAEREGEAFAAAQHLAEVGENDRARGLAARAARHALASLAFDHALRCLDFALRCTPDETSAEQRALTLERGRVLASAGRCAEAAPILLACAEDANGLAAESLRREAMEHFLVAGRVDEGRAVMDRVLKALNVSAPTAPWRVQLALVAEAIPLLVRGPVLGKPRALSEREQVVFETFLSIGKGYASYDGTLGTLFFLRAARQAMVIGDAPRAVRGIAYVATLLGFGGSPARADKWLSAGERVATEHEDGHALAFCQLARGMVACCAGQWEEALTTFDASVAALTEKHAGSAWEVGTAKTTSLVVLLHLGGLRELNRRAKLFAGEAEDRGDLALGVESGLYGAVGRLMADDVPAAEACVDDCLARWTADAYHFQHWIGLRMRSMAALYAGDFPRALSRLQEEIPKAQAARLTAMQLVRVEASDLKGRAALGALLGAHAAEAKRLESTVQRCIRELEKEGPTYALAPASMLRAGLALKTNDTDAAASAFAKAAELYAAAQMRVHALAAQFHEARVRGDATALADAAGGLRRAGVEQPRLWARMHLGYVP